MIDIAVIGAGPAGYSAAITARKRDQSVVVIGQNTGWLARAEHVANYPGLPDISGRDLLSAMANQAQALGAALRPGVVHQVIAMGDSFALSLGADFIEARRVILCTGAKQPKLLPGENELLGRGVSYCGTCDGMLYRGRRVAVIAQGPEAVSEPISSPGSAARSSISASRRTRSTPVSSSAAKSRRRFWARLPFPAFAPGAKTCRLTACSSSARRRRSPRCCRGLRWTAHSSA